MATIIPVGAPQPQTINTTGNSSARDRAISLLSGATPDVNQNSVSAEEMGAIKTQDAGQSDTTEVTTEPSEKEEPISSQYAVLARKEKALRARAVQQEQGLKAREAAIAAREAELESKYKQDLSEYIPKSKLKQNAYNALLEAGVSYDDLTQQALNAQSPEYQQLQAVREEMREELRQLREEQGLTKQSIEQQQSQAYQQALTQIRNEASDLINSDPAYETVKATRSINDVVELIERTFNEDGRLLTVEQAAEAVEEHLVEEAMKMTQIGKIRDRLSKNSAQSQSEQRPVSNQGNMKTLTNSVGSTRQLSARERALLAFKGELK